MSHLYLRASTMCESESACARGPSIQMTPQHYTARALQVWPAEQPVQARSAVAAAEVPPAQALPEAAPHAARQRRSTRGAGGALQRGVPAPNGAKIGQPGVPGIIRGASQDFTIECADGLCIEPPWHAFPDRCFCDGGHQHLAHHVSCAQPRDRAQAALRPGDDGAHDHGGAAPGLGALRGHLRGRPQAHALLGGSCPAAGAARLRRPCGALLPPSGWGKRCTELLCMLLRTIWFDSCCRLDGQSCCLLCVCCGIC